MAIEGDLKDIGLGNIVQLFCLERRKGKLQLRQGGEGGTIFFDSGEIVHAASGDLTGPEAIYKLLTWDSGWFRMTDQAVPPQYTVNINWNHLLLNGMRKIDEQARIQDLSDLPTAPSDGDLTHDRHLESDLVAWFSNAEQILDQLQQKKNLKKPMLAIQLIADMLNNAVGFCETHTKQASDAISLPKALAAALDDYPQTRILYVTNNRISVKTVQNMYRNWGDDPADRLFFMRQVARGIIFTLELFLKRATGQFFSENKRKEWRSAQEVFLLDIRRVSDQISF